jgi:DNA-binding GntR family transcriptional regulator
MNTIFDPIPGRNVAASDLQPHPQKVLMSPYRRTENHSLSLTERVYRRLRKDIITGRIPGGTRMVESALAAKMAVSRTPVREALHKLGLEGLLYAIPRSGYVVEEMSDHDIQDLFDIRLEIEKIAAQKALSRITPDELRHLEENLKRMDQAIRSGMLQNLGELDQEFHVTIYRAARSKTLYRICRNLSDYTLKYRIALSLPPDLVRKMRNHHRSIFNALAAGDETGLASAIHCHLQEAKEQVVELLGQLRQEIF